MTVNETNSLLPSRFCGEIPSRTGAALPICAFRKLNAHLRGCQQSTQHLAHHLPRLTTFSGCSMLFESFHTGVLALLLEGSVATSLWLHHLSNHLHLNPISARTVVALPCPYQLQHSILDSSQHHVIWRLIER